MDELDDTERHGDFSGLTPIAIREVADLHDEDVPATELAAEEVPVAVLDQIKVKVKKLEKFDVIAA